MSVWWFGVMAHIRIIGATGTGKSTHAKHIINTAIQDGWGVLFLTPHAMDADDLLPTIPPHRLKDTFLFDPTEFPLTLNPLDVPAPLHSLVADAFVETMRSVSKMPDAATANMDMTVHSTILTLLKTGGTLCDIPKFLTNKAHRTAITDTFKDEPLNDHWDWFNHLSGKDAQSIVNSTYNKFYQLRADDRLRRVFGHKKTKLDLFDVVHNNRILIARLPNGLLGSGKTKLIGNMLLSLTQVAATTRNNPIPFLFAADECQWWAPDIQEEILTGIRKFNCQYLGIHQFTTQVTPELNDAFKGNSEQHVFRVSPDEAREFQVWFPENALPVNLEDLPNFTYRKFPWRKGDRDVTIAQFEPERFPKSRPYIEETMRRNYIGRGQ